jgi:hypothetical protein
MKNKKINGKLSLDELVDMMMKEQNHNPKDYCFRFIVSVYPKESHKTFNFPGKYMNKVKTEVYTEDGRNLWMDCAQIVLPDSDITCKSTINVEHQSTPLNKNKIDTMYDYKIYLIHKTNLPSNSIIITNINPGQNKIIYNSHDQIFYNHYIVIDEEDISKRLKTLTDIIQNKENLSTVHALNFAVIAIFIDCEQKKETMEKLAYLFSKIEKIEPQLQLDLHHVLKKMIKKHFEDDKNKCKELLKLISESIYETDYKGLTYKERTELRIKELEERKDKQHKQEIQQKDKEIQQKDQQHKQEIQQKDQQHKQEIQQKDQEIEKLKQQLAKQNKNQQ